MMNPNPNQEQSLQQFYAAVKLHGPLPMEWRFQSSGGYENKKKQHSGVYPMSPQARDGGVPLDADKGLPMYNEPGASFVTSSINYIPGNWTWTAGEFQLVLYKVLAYSKPTDKDIGIWYRYSTSYRSLKRRPSSRSMGYRYHLSLSYGYWRRKAIQMRGSNV
jgi:hypothetical protein